MRGMILYSGLIRGLFNYLLMKTRMESGTNQLALAIAFLALVLASGCLSGIGSDLMVIDDGTVLDPAFCESSGIASHVTVFHSPECGACRVTVPVLEEIESESDVIFEFINVDEDRERMEELGMAPGHIPAVVIKCRVYTGYKTKKAFMELIG
jgi:thiol-disulfide isomerase/thioredoxin